MHMMGGVDRPTNGKVFVEGTSIYNLNETQLAIFRRRQIGLVYQFYNLLPVLTVEENITLPLLLDGHKVDKEQFESIVSTRSEEHTSELQSRGHLVCRLLLEKKNSAETAP